MAVWLATMIVVFFVFKTMGTPWLLDSAVWQVMIALGTWILAGSVFLAYRQIKQAQKSTNAQLAVQLFTELRSEKTLKIIRDIYKLKSIGSGKRLSKKVKEDINYVTDRFELLGGLVDMGIIDKKLAIEAYAGTASIRCWYQLHQYVKQIRRERGYCAENYEAFARLSLDHYYRNKIEVTFYQIGEKDKELVFTELQKGNIKPRKPKDIKKQREDAWKTEQRKTKKHHEKKWWKRLWPFKRKDKKKPTIEE